MAGLVTLLAYHAIRMSYPDDVELLFEPYVFTEALLPIERMYALQVMTYQAILFDRPDFVRLMVAYGADAYGFSAIWPSDDGLYDRMTLTEHCVTHGSAACVEMLAESGVFGVHFDHSGYFRNAEITLALIKCGVDVHGELPPQGDTRPWAIMPGRRRGRRC